MFLNYRRSTLSYVLLWIFTLGIYHFIFKAQVADDTNTAFGEEVIEKPDAKYVILSILTFGVYAVLCDIKTLNKWNEYYTKKEIDYQIDTSSYKFLALAPIVRIMALREYIDAFNIVCRKYTDEQLEAVEDEYFFIHLIRQEAAERKKREEELAGLAFVEEYITGDEQEDDKKEAIVYKKPKKVHEILEDQPVDDCFRNKEWFVRAFVAMLAVFMLPILLVVTTVFILPPVYDDTFVGELGEKYDRLNSIDKDKIIVVGGSSVAFGLDSALMEEHLGMEVVNFGLYANLGTKIMMDLSRTNINNGDIIILAPEMNAQTLSLYFNSETTMQALDGNMKMLFGIDSENYESLIGASWKFTCDKLSYLFTGKRPMNEGAYKKENFNKYGDNIYDRPYNEMTGIQNTITLNFKTNYNDSIHSDFEQYIEYVNEYVAYAESKGATVYFSFCPMNYAAMSKKNTEESIRNFYKALCYDLDCKVISNVYDYIFEEGYFFDSEFHLNNAGVTLRTVQLIDDIKREMEDTSVTIPIQELPKAPGYRPYSPYLDIQATEDGLKWIVIGLTEEGFKQEEIIIPDTISDKPVIMIEENAFNNAVNLKKLTIGKNIQEIGSYAFSGAVNMTKIVIPDGIGSNAIKLPESGSMILGCRDDLKIYVDSDLYDSFVNDADWEVYVENLYSEHFNYIFEKAEDALGEYWIITGVNEDGKLSTELTVPAAYQGLPVKVIGANAFAGCNSLTKIVLGDNIISIGEKAFSGAPSLKTVIFPKTKGPNDISVPNTAGSLITEGCADVKLFVGNAHYEAFIGSAAYSSYVSLITCENTDLKLEQVSLQGAPAWSIIGLTESGKKLKEITIPAFVDGIPVANIASNAFSGGVIEVLYVGENIVNMEASAFAGAANLEKVIIPDSITAEKISVPNNMAGALATEGCNPKLKIYVSDESFEGFQADYFWGDYGIYLKPKSELQ